MLLWIVVGWLLCKADKMSEAWRVTRRAELLTLRSTDPIKLLSLYRQVAGLTIESQLPHGVSFTAMIDAVLDDEAKRRQIDGTADD